MTIRAEVAPQGGTVRPIRGRFGELRDALTFPLRAFALIDGPGRWGLSSLASERMEYVRHYVLGRTLDIGCGRHNRFITEFLGGNGRGVDVFQYEGLDSTHLVGDLTRLPFTDGSFDSVTFIASLNHAPDRVRQREVDEAFRCLRTGGNIVVTMGNPIAEVAIHHLLAFYDRFLGTSVDVDGQRGMEEGESYYLTDTEIRCLLSHAGFVDMTKRSFVTQWGLNHLLIGTKPQSEERAVP